MPGSAHPWSLAWERLIPHREGPISEVAGQQGHISGSMAWMLPVHLVIDPAQPRFHAYGGGAGAAKDIEVYTHNGHRGWRTYRVHQGDREEGRRCPDERPLAIEGHTQSLRPERADCPVHPARPRKLPFVSLLHCVVS
jgi:hypothetical protein